MSVLERRQRPAPAGRHRTPWLRRPDPLVVLVVVAGGVLRFLASGHFWGVDADEAVTGTMAQALLERHEWPVFFWGQSYGGTLEVGLVAAVLAVLPDTTLALRLLPIVTSAVVPLVIYAVGRRLYGRTGALVAAAVLWCPVQAIAWFQDRQMLFYQPTLLIGSMLLVLSLRFFDRPGVPVAAATGFLSGLGFWMSTNILFFVLPAGVAMLAAGWSALPRAVAAIPAGAAGAAPWLLWNLRYDFLSLQIPHEFRSGSFVDHLDVYVTKGVPMLVGAASPSGWDLPWRRVGILVAIGLGAALLAAAVRSLVRWRPGTPPPVDAVGLLAAPLVYSVNPLAGTVLVPRYLLFPLAFFALVAGRLATSRRVAVPALATVIGLSALTLTKPFQFTGTRAELEPVEEVLAARQITLVYADYWVTFPLAYQTEGTVIGSPFYAHRRPRWDIEVAQAAAPAYVFMCNSPDLELVEATAAAQGIAFEREAAGAYVVLFLSANLPPAQVAPQRALRDGDPHTQHRCKS